MRTILFLAFLAWLGAPMVAMSSEAGDPSLTILEARANAGLVVRYRVTNPGPTQVWLVCPEQRCSRGDWPRVPFLVEEGTTLNVSAAVVRPPEGVMYEVLYVHELVPIAPNSSYEGMIAIEPPIESAPPYPQRERQRLNMDAFSRVVLRVGLLPCLDPALSTSRPPTVGVGTVLSCARGKTAIDVQTVLTAEKPLSRARAK